ncbi:MAG: hypothetical protein PHC69_10070, partial [Ruminiclostridium sp.]|nr:hypothetical protein [Ruminiclostridium sp.]
TEAEIGLSPAYSCFLALVAKNTLPLFVVYRPHEAGVLGHLINTNIDILYQQNTVRMRTGNSLINAKLTYYDSFKQESCGYIPQMPFEDEYYQLVPYDD